MEKTRKGSGSEVPLEQRLEMLSSAIEKVALKIIRLQKVQKESPKYTLQQYYYIKEEVLESVAEVSTTIEESLPVSVRAASLDARLILDSFNEQVEKLMRVVEGEDNLEFAPSLVAVIKIDQSPAKKEEDKATSD